MPTRFPDRKPADPNANGSLVGVVRKTVVFPTKGDMGRTHAEEVPAALPDKVSRRLSAVSATCRVGEAALIINSGLP
jgi:hypothetical protein